MESKRFDLIIFDLDGTLFDTKWTILNALTGYVKKMGLRTLTEEEVQSFFGPPAIRSFKRFYPDMTDSEIDDLLIDYRKYYNENELLKAKLYPGTREVLEKLRNGNYKIAMASYKMIKSVDLLLDHNDMRKYFDVIKGSLAEVGSTKSGMMKEAIAECGVADYDRACMVGDSMYDTDAAIELSVPFIGMNYAGTFDTLRDKERDYKKFIGLCNKASDILELIK